jgi:predicted acyl esterase
MMLASITTFRNPLLATALLVPLLGACGDDGDKGQPAPTATARPSDTPQPTATAPPTGTTEPTATGVPTATPAPGDTATEGPTATATPTGRTEVPTDTPTPSPTGPTVVPTDTPAGLTPTFTPTPAGPTPTPTPVLTLPPTPVDPTATFTPVPLALRVHGSVLQLFITDSDPGTDVELLDDAGDLLRTGTTDGQGTLIFRDLVAGAGYRVAVGEGAERQILGPFEVTAPEDAPDASFYAEQEIGRGYGYLKTRDGTLLAINVILPGPVEEGPYPTVIEYSGYDPANPESPEPSTLIASLLGYAAVGVNMRGTGCSGGAFQFFEPAQWTDGYDAVEAIAAQPWVKGNKVGMVGVSYPGITQLFVAQLRPPHLAAIAPLSVISDTFRGTLYPGGILNDGFAVEWAAERQGDAVPGGQPWSQRRMDAGDEICIQNQKLRSQSPDIFQMIRDNAFYSAAVGDPVAPTTFVDKIDVPVFLAGTWQDEQVGGYFANMLGNFTGTDRAHFTVVNGGHTDPLGPEIFPRWNEFLSFYVREEVPELPASVVPLIQVVGQQIFGVPGLTVEPDRFTGMSFEDALASFESEPRLRVLFENGAGDPARPGSPYPSFEMSFEDWPVPGTEARTWYFASGGLLAGDPPTSDGADTFTYDPSSSQLTICETCTRQEDYWVALPPFHWPGLGTGTSAAYATEPLDEDLVMIGSGSVDLWLGSTAPDVDVQVTLSEIRPDGQELYVQNGWLRASRRKLDQNASSELRPVQTHLEEDAAPLPLGGVAEARVEIFPFAHVFRAGSRIRISVEAPGGSRPRWRFEALPADGPVINTIARSRTAASRIVLPVVPGVEAPADLPPCPGLRLQPCRLYED